MREALWPDIHACVAQSRLVAPERTRSSGGRIGAIDPEQILAQWTMNDSSAPMHEPAPREGCLGKVGRIHRRR
jgi:hypothetical protein